MPETPAVTRVCRNFRTKAMFAREQGQDKIKATEQTLHFPFCWCAKTATETGPDDLLAGPESCAKPGRPCYEG
jgi:hypothetical protein